MRHRLRAALLITVLGGVLLAGCTRPEAPEQPPAASAAKSAADLQQANFPEIYSQEIAWRDCQISDGLTSVVVDDLEEAGVDVASLQCGVVTAPLDWANPDSSETVELAVNRIPATGEASQGVLFGNPGGPGEPGRDFMFSMAMSAGFDAVLNNYDLVGLDPRGIGASSPIECAKDGFENPALALSECIATNQLAHHMGTSSVARDLELLRFLLGQEKLNFLGYSWATMLGATYATLFEDKVGRMVLDSAEDAKWASPVHRFDQKVAIVAAIEALLAACPSSQELCPLAEGETLQSLIERYDEQPLNMPDDSELTGQDILSILTDALYQSPQNQSDTLGFLTLALQGQSEAQDVFLSSAEELPESGINLAGEIVTCHSFPLDADLDGLVDHAEQVGVPAALGGPEPNDDNLAEFTDLSCAVLPERGTDITDTFSAPGVTSILVIGITGDHATPYQYADELVSQLGAATLVTLEGLGHAASFQERSACIDELVVDFLNEGALPPKDTICRDAT